MHTVGFFSSLGFRYSTHNCHNFFSFWMLGVRQAGTLFITCEGKLHSLGYTGTPGVGQLFSLNLKTEQQVHYSIHYNTYMDNMDIIANSLKISKLVRLKCRMSKNNQEREKRGERESEKERKRKKWRRRRQKEEIL